MPVAPTGYPPASDGRRESIARIERRLICDLLDEVGPRRPTLCDGWTTHHLAAHLSIREGGPLEQFRRVLPGAAGDRMVEAAVRSRPFDALVRQIRGGPPRFSAFGVPGADRALNTLEFFIHHEDVRRAEDGWEPRDLPGWAQDAVWGQVVRAARLAMLRRGRSLILRRLDTGIETQVSRGAGRRVVVGLPTELALYVSGRRDAALVERTG